MNYYTSKSRVVLAEMNKPVIDQSMDETRNDVVISDTPQDIIHEMTSTQEPRRSGRIIRPSVRFIGLGETYEAISEQAKFDPYIYEEAIKDIDAHHCFMTIVEQLHNPKIQGITRKESTQKESIILFETLWLEEMWQQQRLIVQIIQQIPLPKLCPEDF